MNSFAVYYIESNIACVLVFGILLIHNHFNIDRQEKQIKFDQVLTVFMLYFLADCFWAASVGGLIPKTRLNVVLIDFMLYLFMAAITFFWLDYAMAYEQVPHRNRPINRFVAAFPFLASTAALILNYILAPQFLLDDALNTAPGYNVYLVTVPSIYMAAILFYAIRKARAEETRQEKRNHLFVGLFPLMVIAGGLVEILAFPRIPIFCFCAMLLMLVFYIRSLDLRISLDPLTQLNNRGQLTRYISQRSNLAVEGRLTIVVMLDIDEFKAINDRYGHAEGDKALVFVADSLRKVIHRHSMPSFIARYGGDEFILILHPVAEEEADRLIRELREEIDQANGNSSYTLSISVGFSDLKDGPDSVQSCIERADKLLYHDKASKSRRIKP